MLEGMAKRETLTTRVTRLEDLAATPLDAQIKTEDHFRQTDARIVQLREEANEREKRSGRAHREASRRDGD